MNAEQVVAEVTRIHSAAREKEHRWALHEAQKFVQEHADTSLTEYQREQALHSAQEYFSYEGSDDDEEFKRLYCMCHALHGESVR